MKKYLLLILSLLLIASTWDICFSESPHIFGITKVPFLDFNLDEDIEHQEGRLHWDDDDGTLELGMPGGNVRLQIGQEGLKICRNITGSTIENGSLVYTVGSSGNKPLIDLCDNTDPTKIHLLGMATEDIDNNSNGYVALWGSVSGETSEPIDTSLYVVGTELYMSTGGTWTGTKPTDVSHTVIIIGEVQRQHSSEGKIELLPPKIYTHGGSYNGPLRYGLINSSTGSSAAAAFTSVNDNGYYVTFGIGGSNNSIFPDTTILYGQGYADNIYVVDGNKSHKWYTDSTDSHNYSATSKMELTADGDLDVPTGNITQETYQRHIQVQAIPSGTVANQATGNTVGTAVGLQFASTPDKYAGFQWEIPNDWVGGEDITIEIDWMPDSGSMSGDDTVQWILEYRAVAEGELVTQGTAVTVTVTNDDDNAQYLTIHSPFTIDYDSGDQPLTKQDHIFFLLHRNTAVANDFAGTVTGTAFEVLYNSNQMPRSN